MYSEKTIRKLLDLHDSDRGLPSVDPDDFGAEDGTESDGGTEIVV